MSNTLTFPSVAPALPDYTFHDGRTIVWEPWIVAAHITCLGPSACERCDSTGRPLFAVGRAQPLPGEMFTGTAPRRGGHQEGMAVKQVQVPAWAVRRLCAFRCPGCAHVDVLDMDNDYEPVNTEQPTLF